VGGTGSSSGVDQAASGRLTGSRARSSRLDYESHATALDRNEMGALLVAARPGPATEHAVISLLALNGPAGIGGNRRGHRGPGHRARPPDPGHHPQGRQGHHHPTGTPHRPGHRPGHRRTLRRTDCRLYGAGWVWEDETHNEGARVKVHYRLMRSAPWPENIRAVSTS